ncbi:MAG: TetR/AcrR family transcriptional regulator [Alphaproteobacteria bacterium]|nr:TetR/AcrR family transcriptional regulator [Alphaproteobacteria bacterium]
MPPSKPSSRPLRADARRNQAHILEAAEAVFDTEGPSGSTEAIARRAGVAVGTVFRHFPTKADLIQAVFTARLQRLTDHAVQLQGAEDPGEAFLDFFLGWAELSATKLTFAEALIGEGVDVRALARQDAYLRMRQNLLQAVEGLLQRAQRAGRVRGDVGITELNALLIGTARALEQVRDDPDASARTLEVVLDGLRLRGAPPPDR